MFVAKSGRKDRTREPWFGLVSVSSVNSRQFEQSASRPPQLELPFRRLARERFRERRELGPQSLRIEDEGF